jgi:outer membrane protein OmpA-like peptidoglycan-associated protein
MNPHALLVPILALVLASGAVAQTQPTQPPPQPPGPPQIAPRPVQPGPVPQPPTQLQSEFAVAVGDTVMFPYQSAELTLRSLKILDNQAKWLVAKPEIKVRLEAYCDDDIDPAQAREFCLSRARAVRDYLVKQGVKSERISLAAFDDSQAPRTGSKAETKKGKKDKKDKKDEKNRRTNRRVSTRVSS